MRVTLLDLSLSALLLSTCACAPRQTSQYRTAIKGDGFGNILGKQFSYTSGGEHRVVLKIGPGVTLAGWSFDRLGQSSDKVNAHSIKELAIDTATAMSRVIAVEIRADIEGQFDLNNPIGRQAVHTVRACADVYRLDLAVSTCCICESTHFVKIHWPRAEPIEQGCEMLCHCDIHHSLCREHWRGLRERYAQLITTSRSSSQTYIASQRYAIQQNGDRKIARISMETMQSLRRDKPPPSQGVWHASAASMRSLLWPFLSLLGLVQICLSESRSCTYTATVMAIASCTLVPGQPYFVFKTSGTSKVRLQIGISVTTREYWRADWVPRSPVARNAKVWAIGNKDHSTDNVIARTVVIQTPMEPWLKPLPDDEMGRLFRDCCDPLAQHTSLIQWPRKDPVNETCKGIVVCYPSRGAQCAAMWPEEFTYDCTTQCDTTWPWAPSG